MLYRATKAGIIERICSEIETIIVDLNAVALFVRVVETGSFTAAARESGLPKSTVSRQIAQLEAQLGTTLLHRSTRSVSATDLGRELYERAAAGLRATQAALALVGSRHGHAVGTVRITATTGFAQIVLAPILFTLMREEAGLRVDLRLSDARIDVIEEGIDIAIRMGRLEDSELKARKLCLVSRLICASATYIEKHGVPANIASLSSHEAIVTAASLNRWRFADGTELAMRWRFAAGNILLAREAALAGQGLALLPRFLVADDLASGRLVEVLADQPLIKAEATAVLPGDRLTAPATTLILDHLVAALRGREL